MFAKVFKTRSNTAIKGSDRRKLRADISTVFPSLTTENLSELMPPKDELNIVKAYAHKGDSVTIYVRNRNPIMFELERNLYPTVYTLWSYPDLLPAFMTWPLVLEKLIGGAEAMDSLLHQCFFHAVKHKVKKADLPLLTSTFLRNYIFPCCPEGRQVDIKKSSYKKMSKFLQSMQQRKILQVKELTKGVESIVDIDWKHPDIRTFVPPPSVPAVSVTSESMDGGGEPPYQPPEIISLYSVSAKMMPLFQDTGHRKGDLLTASDVRSIIITYVKTNELIDSNNKNFVTINPILCDCLLDKSEYNVISTLKWEDLITRCLERMQHSYQVLFPGHSPVIRKGDIEPIDISVVQRGSNKKVTVIKNLELYGLDPTSVASVLQQRVQASASCSVLPGSKDRVQLQIQGNQVSQIGKLLQENFKIPRKYVNGLDLAVKSGKKK
ncbi:eukaryotic translation initiation factor 2D [Discoglossus pictus]